MKFFVKNIIFKNQLRTQLQIIGRDRETKKNCIIKNKERIDVKMSNKLFIYNYFLIFCYNYNIYFFYLYK